MSVCITHPAHPLQGQSFPLVQHHRKGQDTHLVKIQLDNGEHRLIPLAWTDQAPPRTTLPGARFVLANLISLRQLLDMLLPTLEKSGILPPQTDSRGKGGGTDEIPEPVPVAQTDGCPTSTERGYSGTNAFAPTGAAAGG
ncbi:MAG: hypothetical protein KAX24_02195 [Anaerolineae bacterium]|nr:hypothetical protein [Anaerolineae bacterium]